MMKKTVASALILLVIACSPTARITVTNVNNVSNISGSSSYYSLPLTVFAVRVFALRESFVPGPYFMYARKYLGIADVVTKPYQQWSIVDLQVSHYLETDPDFLFTVSSQPASSFAEILQQLSNDSLILLPAHFATRQVFGGLHEDGTLRPAFTDLSVKRNFEMKKGTQISEVLPDTLFADLPVAGSKDEPVFKTTEQKAEEAANFIIKLRKRRFKLISGQYTYMPEGEALDRAIDELNRIEKQYLSLFTGIRTVTEQSQVFHYLPDNGKELNRTILLRFSETEGFLEARESRGKPVLVEIQDMNKTKGLDAIKLNLKESENQLFYRIPDQSFIRVLYGETLMREAKFPVYQFGTLVGMTVAVKK
jgi:hypothetical protein